MHLPNETLGLTSLKEELLLKGKPTPISNPYCLMVYQVHQMVDSIRDKLTDERAGVVVGI